MYRKNFSPLRCLLALIISLGAVVAMSPAATAEIEPQPRNADGVVGVATGTQSEPVRTSVWAIEQIGDTVYVGGKFTQVTNGAGTENQPFLAAFSASTGRWIPGFRPSVNNSVNALDVSPDGSTLFVGGDFTTVNGQNQRVFAALDPTTGATKSFAGRVTSGSSVRGLDVQGGFVYLVGTFFQLNSGGASTTVNSAARISLNTGRHDPNWAPNISGGRAWDIAASSNADRVYMTGFFSTVNGQDKPGGFAAVSASTGDNIVGTQPFRTNTNRDYAQAVEVHNGLVWVGGSEHYVYVMNESDLGLKVFHLSNRTGDFQDLEVVGNRVYAGCHCRVGTNLYTRFDDVIPFPASSSDLAQADDVGTSNWVVAFDATTGLQVDSFNPLVRSTGPGVWAIHGAPDGCLWIGGTLHRSNEQPVDNVVRMCDGDGGPGPGSDTERPSTPGAARVTDSGSGYVDLAWNGSTDNVAVTGYTVFNSANNSELFSSSNAFGRLNAPDGTYNVYVRAFDAAGNLSWRSGVRQLTITSGGPADTQRPSPPGAPRIVGSGNGFVDLQWTSGTDNVGVVGHRLYDLNTGSLLIDVTGTTARLTLADGTYRVYAKAYDAAGNESWRSGTRTVTIN